MLGFHVFEIIWPRKSFKFQAYIWVSASLLWCKLSYMWLVGLWHNITCILFPPNQTSLHHHHCNAYRDYLHHHLQRNYFTELHQRFQHIRKLYGCHSQIIYLTSHSQILFVCLGLSTLVSDLPDMSLWKWPLLCPWTNEYGS